MDAADTAGPPPGGTPGQADAGRRDAPAAPPTPVRAAPPVAAAPSEPARASAADVELEAGGERWTVRVIGRSVSGPALAPMPFLLLGFFLADEPAAPRREALLVGRDLADLTDLELLAAWHSGRSPRPAGERRPFFPEIAGKGGKEG